MTTQRVASSEISGYMRSCTWDFVVAGDLNSVSGPRSNAITIANCEILQLQSTESNGSSRYLLTSRDSNANEELSWMELLLRFKAFGISARTECAIDLTSLRFDSLLYVVRALQDIGLTSVDLLYLLPMKYDDDPTIEQFGEIKQPKGYVNLVDSQLRTQLFFLGFDELRAERFIHLYDWRLEQIYFVIGDPPTITGGFERAYATLSPETQAFLKLNPEHLVRIDACSVQAAANVISSMAERFPHLDLIPLGPKPWTFAVATCFLELSRKPTNSLRVLYDYASRRDGRSTGLQALVQQSWILNV
jgi:hypothetical protein